MFVAFIAINIYSLSSVLDQYSDNGAGACEVRQLKDIGRDHVVAIQVHLETFADYSGSRVCAATPSSKLFIHSHRHLRMSNRSLPVGVRIIHSTLSTNRKILRAVSATTNLHDGSA